MAFTLKQLALWASEGLAGTAQQQWSYWENATLATISASAYMDDASDRFQKDDLIWMVGSDDAELFKVTSTTGATPVTVAQVTGAAANLPLADGDYFVGNASGIATAVTMSGDVTQTNAGVTTVGSIDLETATVTNIADTEFLIGTGAGTANFAAFSSDVTVTNAGVATVAALDLESATVTNITDTEVMIGTGAGTANFAALSQDATMTNAGAVTVVSAQGDFEMGAGGSGKVIATGITATSGAGAVSIAGRIHEVTTTGTGDALTLANGTAGQQLTVIYVAEGAGSDTAVLTPTTLAGGSTITFNALGDSADLTYSATGGWYMHGGTATIA